MQAELQGLTNKIRAEKRNNKQEQSSQGGTMNKKNPCEAGQTRAESNKLDKKEQNQEVHQQTRAIIARRNDKQEQTSHGLKNESRNASLDE
jgi:hypothetical protein